MIVSQTPGDDDDDEEDGIAYLPCFRLRIERS